MLDPKLVVVAALVACGTPPAPQPIQNVGTSPPRAADQATKACPEIELAKVTPDTAQVGAVAGIVRDARCELLAGVTIVATSPSLQGTLVDITNESGRFVLGALPPGTYVFTFYYSDVTAERKDVRVRAGLVEQVSMILPPQTPGEIIKIH